MLMCANAALALPTGGAWGIQSWEILVSCNKFWKRLLTALFGFSSCVSGSLNSPGREFTQFLRISGDHVTCRWPVYKAAF